MAKRTGAVHVATTRRKYNGKVYETHLLRRTFREDGKVKHETLGNISHLPPDIIEIIRHSLAGRKYVPANEAMEITRSLAHGHVAAVLGTIASIGLESIIYSRKCRERDLVVAMVAHRILNPGSKLTLARDLDPLIANSTLGNSLGLEDVDEEDLYSAMDWLIGQQARIEKKLAKKHLKGGSVVLYDVSSSYYTGNHCELVKFGHNRDGKKRYPQIVYGLLCNAQGCPVAIEVFEGNTADPKTLNSQVEKLLKKFELKNIILVGDRGMITSARIREELVDVEGLDWITALNSKAIQIMERQGIIQPSLFDERNLLEVQSPDYPGERLIVCRNPALAIERARKREDLLSATEAKLQKIADAVNQEKRSLRGSDKIGMRVGKIINKHKMGKHFDLTIEDNNFQFKRREENIKNEARLDGIYVIRTSVKERVMNSNEVVGTYKSLSRVEQAFRSLKTVDLKVRPIYHRKSERVRSHVFLCMLAYYVEWHMRQNLAPVLFDDEDKYSPMSPGKSAANRATRSKPAELKARTRLTPDGKPVHSFQTLLTDLATITRNTVATPNSNGSEFYMLTTPTKIQRHYLDLLGVKLKL